MARKLVVELFLDARQYERGLKSAAGGAKQFQHSMEGLNRGTVRGVSAFRGLGRSLAFATGGFVGFQTASEFLRTSIDAARDAGRAQRSLAAQMKASGESFAANRKRVEELALSYGKFGFNNDEVIQSLTVLERGTGNINKAMKLQMLTADIARAKNIGLAQAAQAVAKVFGGQETALRRLVPGLPKTAHGMTLIADAEERMRGQAAANTTAADKFASTLHNTQEIIGTALLPILNKYLDSLSKWLEMMNRSGKLQRDLNKAMKDAKPVIDDLAHALWGLGKAYDFMTTQRDKAEKDPKFAWIFKSGIYLREALKAVGINLPVVGGTGGGTGRPPGVAGPVGRPTPVTGPAGPTGPVGTTGGTMPPGVPISLRNQWFDARIARQLDRVQDLSLRKQLERLKYIAQEVRDRMAVTKDLTRRLNLQDKLVEILRQERDVQKQITDQIKQGTQALKDRADAIKSAVLSRMDARQQAIENKQQLRDSLDALRLAQRIGGPQGIKLAQRQVEAAKFAIARAGVEAGTFRVRNVGGGMQAVTVGNQIVINVHGAESPEQVARKVVEIIQRRSRHTSSQQRGPTSGTATQGPR